MEEKLYFRTSRDKYELPIGVCSRSETMRVHGKTPQYIASKKSGNHWVSVKDSHTGRQKSTYSDEWVDAIYMRVDELITKSGKNKTQLAKKFGVSRKYFISNRCFPSVEKLIGWADMFGVSVDYLLGREEREDGKKKQRR